VTGRAELGDGGEEEEEEVGEPGTGTGTNASAGGRVPSGEKERGVFCKNAGAQVISGRREYKLH
jgi:hypothetical protein